MYKHQKMIQAIGYLLSLNDGRMNLLKLMKELYYIDRESINERNVSVSGDIHVSMNRGPVLSKTYTILDEVSIRDSEHPWAEYISSTPTRYYPDIVLKESPGEDRLSPKDKEYIGLVSDRYKNYEPFDLAELTHSLPEWKDPKGSCIDIRFYDIMKALNKSDEEIAHAKLEYQKVGELYEMLGVE